MYSLWSPAISLNYEFIDTHEQVVKIKKNYPVCDFIILVYIIDSLQAKGLSNYVKMAMTLDHAVTNMMIYS